MKKYILIVLLFSSLFLISACGITEKLNGGEGNKSAEKKEWPNNSNTKGVPVPEFKKINLVFDEGGVTNITYGDVSKSDSDEYLEKLKENGFTDDVSTSSAGGNLYYGAKNKKTGIHLSYNRSPDGTVSISFDDIGK